MNEHKFDLLKKQITTYNELTIFQKKVLDKLFNDFGNIARMADYFLDKLEVPQFFMDKNDDELVIWLKDGIDLKNIIINDDCSFAYSIIPIKDKSTLKFFTLDDPTYNMCEDFLDYLV